MNHRDFLPMLGFIVLLLAIYMPQE